MSKIEALQSLPLPIFWAIGGNMALDMLDNSPYMTKQDYIKCRELLMINGQVMPNIISKCFDITGVEAEPTEYYNNLADDYLDILDTLKYKMSKQKTQDARISFVKSKILPHARQHPFIMLRSEIRNACSNLYDNGEELLAGNIRILLNKTLPESSRLSMLIDYLSH
jgi:hypothetical protein